MTDFNEHKSHFGPISQGLIDYVTNEVLLYSRYLFTQTSVRIQYAYCTHCNNRHKPEIPLKHNTSAVCPKCNSTCTVKKSHVGRKYMNDTAYVVFYEKSIIDPDVMTARGFHVKRNYSGSYENVQTVYSPSCSYVFQMGNSSMFYTGYYNDTIWYQRKNVVSEYSFYKNGTPCYYNRNSIQAAVAGTPFQYSTWENYDEQDMVKFFGLYSKYPCIEYLTKMGYDYFVMAKLFGLRTYDAIKWNGKTVNEILKMDKQDLRMFKQQFPRISYYQDGEFKALSLRLYQLTRKDSNRPAIVDLFNLSRNIMGYFNDLKPMLKFENLMYCVAYVNRQFKKGKKEYHTKTDVLITWKDYMAQCITLGFDLSREEVVFPYNLHASHESTTSQIEVKVSLEAKEKIKNRLLELEKYRFCFNGFIIRAAESAEEIIEEGKALRHCVGDYAKRHAEGETTILVIRKFADPETPFYTMELKDGKIRQTRGYKNILARFDIAEFVQVFESQVLAKKKTKPKLNNQSKSVKQQGVAV